MVLSYFTRKDKEIMYKNETSKRDNLECETKSISEPSINPIDYMFKHSSPYLKEGQFSFKPLSFDDIPKHLHRYFDLNSQHPFTVMGNCSNNSGLTLSVKLCDQ